MKQIHQLTQLSLGHSEQITKYYSGIMYEFSSWEVKISCQRLGSEMLLLD